MQDTQKMYVHVIRMTDTAAKWMFNRENRICIYTIYIETYNMYALNVYLVIVL